MFNRFPRGLRHAFSRARRAGAAVEFALCSFALFAFILAILNLGMLGFDLGSLAHGVQASARHAGVDAAATYANTGTMTCDSASTIRGYFNNVSAPPLPAASGSTTDGTPAVTASWTNNAASGSTSEPPGIYLNLAVSYKWKAIGFPFGSGITLNIATVILAPGSAGLSATAVGGSC
jgi:Flp pilus assembly protein TadG